MEFSNIRWQPGCLKLQSCFHRTFAEVWWRNHLNFRLNFFEMYTGTFFFFRSRQQFLLQRTLLAFPQSDNEEKIQTGDGHCKEWKIPIGESPENGRLRKEPSHIQKHKFGEMPMV
ncbi:hypothetical protein ACJMK2_021645 [Sinanodonta woodiana]|uniref:Uncharacterized protein n=1 Tax=Sinanodonta woodiana TaxID=1069815 RepID=A0ABD3TIN2_SINWO